MLCSEELATECVSTAGHDEHPASSLAQGGEHQHLVADESFCSCGAGNPTDLCCLCVFAGTIRFNDRVLSQFQQFYGRPDTWSLGICNGCQLMALLGWVPSNSSTQQPLPDLQQPRFVHNKSGRFESRWVTVAIDESTPSVLLKGMGGATIGVWAAHGEGQALFPSQDVFDRVLSKGLAPIR